MSSNRETDRIMALEGSHDLDRSDDNLLERILNRPCSAMSERYPRSSSQLSDYKPMDARWLSSEKLTEPWEYEDKWWMTNRVNSQFLDTDGRVFGRKKIYLVDSKKSSKSVNDISETLAAKQPLLRSIPNF